MGIEEPTTRAIRARRVAARSGETEDPMTDHDDMATPKDIDPGIRERCERATEGPWWVESCAGLVFVRTTGDRPIDEFHDKLFIAHARTDIPALLDDRDRLVAWIGRLQERLREEIDIGTCPVCGGIRYEPEVCICEESDD